MKVDTILVTGGAGFIGSALVRHLIQETDTRVVNVDCLTYAGNLESLEAVERDPRYVHERVDITNAAEIRRVFSRARPRAVVHLAAETHVDRSIDGPTVFLDTNILGTFTLLQCARAYWQELAEPQRSRFRFHHVSTDEVYGTADPGQGFTEETRYAPNSPYAASKAASDHLVRSWHRTFGLPVLTTNCSNNYGPYQFPEKLIPHMILTALEGKPLPIYGDGKHERDWLYVQDHVEALLAALEGAEPGEVLNIGGDAVLPNVDVVRAICSILDDEHPRSGGRSYSDLISFVRDRPGHDRRYAMDAHRIRSRLGWQPKETFESGLRKTIRWYLGHEGWWSRIRSGVYRGERLGKVP